MMIVDGIVVSVVTVSDRGVGFKVMCKDFGDTFRVFIPADRVKGEHHLNMYDSIKVDFDEFFLSENEVRMEVKRVTLGNGKK